MSRFSNLDEIRRLDPEKDHQRIAYLDSVFEFPWDTTRSLEFALFRTYGVPKSSRLLQHTEELEYRTQKRYDDTVLILSEILEHGYDSERGLTALRRMNQQHGTYPISNEEFLYVLTTFVFEPIRWMERFAWRPMIREEKLANYYYCANSVSVWALKISRTPTKHSNNTTWNTKQNIFDLTRRTGALVRQR